MDLAVQLLGQSLEVSECIKYKELKQKHPQHSSFSSQYDQWLVKLQMQVSKKYHQLKEKIDNMKTESAEKERLKSDKKTAKKLLDHWCMYYMKDD